MSALKHDFDSSTSAFDDSRENRETLPSGSITNISRLTQIPCSLLGKVFDQGKASADAAHLLAIKLSKGPGFVLNRQHVAKEYGIGQRSFLAGMKALKSAKVLVREQKNRRTYATETLAGGDRPYVLINDTLLKQPSAVVAFVLAINLSPEPVRPADMAKRFGVVSRMTIRKMTAAAVENGCVSNEAKRPSPVLLARRGYVFPVAEKLMAKNATAKNAMAKNATAHSILEEVTVYETNPPKPENSSGYGTRSDERGHTVEERRELGPEWLVLKDWKSSPFWSERAVVVGEVDHVPFLEIWRASLLAYGGDSVPGHLKTPHSCRQALEILKELNRLCYGTEDLHRGIAAFAFHVCKALAQGKRIRSFGFIAQNLFSYVDDFDDSWLYDIPTRLPQSQFDEAARLASKAVSAMESYGIKVMGRVLQSTQEVERLALFISQYGWNGVVQGMNHANEHAERLEGSIWCWNWVKPSIEAVGSRSNSSRNRSRRAG